ncbi:hypothetical protein [Mesorhizobium sp. 128a]
MLQVNWKRARARRTGALTMARIAFVVDPDRDHIEAVFDAPA